MYMDSYLFCCMPVAPLDKGVAYFLLSAFREIGRMQKGVIPILLPHCKDNKTAAIRDLKPRKNHHMESAG